MRHGTAENLFTFDEERALIPLASKEIKSSIVQLEPYTQHFDWTIYSPFLRARQSYDIVNEVANIEDAAESGEITPSGDAKAFKGQLDLQLLERPQVEHLLVVSHLPFVSYFLDELAEQSNGFFFPPAAIAILDYDITTCSGRFVELVTPDV